MLRVTYLGRLSNQRSSIFRGQLSCCEGEVSEGGVCSQGFGFRCFDKHNDAMTTVWVHCLPTLLLTAQSISIV